MTGSVLGFNEEEAAEQWGDAFRWVETGRILSQSGQAPLTLGSYLVAVKQFKELAKHFPYYETKMVSYRINALQRDIKELKSAASDDDLSIADQYVAFIKLIDQADQERLFAQRKKALKTLRKAKIGLNAIVARRPDSFIPAMQSQAKRIDGDINWLEDLVGETHEHELVTITSTSNPTPRKPGPLVITTKSAPPLGELIPLPPQPPGKLIKGTTEFIKVTDLPNNPGLVATSSLFPGG